MFSLLFSLDFHLLHSSFLCFHLLIFFLYLVCYMFILYSFFHVLYVCFNFKILQHLIDVFNGNGLMMLWCYSVETFLIYLLLNNIPY
jgi:hypothetical protein